MKNIVEKTYGEVTVVERSDYKWAVIDNKGNEIVPFGKYGWIDGFDKGLARVRTPKDPGYTKNIAVIFGEKGIITDPQEIKNTINEDKRKNPHNYAKWGIINEKGEEVLPCEYDEIWNFVGKNRYSTRVVKNGVSSDVYFHDLNPALPDRGVKKTFSIWENDWKERAVCEEYDDMYVPWSDQDFDRTYEDYNGTYVQDVMHWSDQDISDALDGIPEAYWNID